MAKTNLQAKVAANRDTVVSRRTWPSLSQKHDVARRTWPSLSQKHDVARRTWPSLSQKHDVSRRTWPSLKLYYASVPLSAVSCLSAPVSSIMPQCPCQQYHASVPLSAVSCLSAPVSCIMPQCPCQLYHASVTLSAVSCLSDPLSCNMWGRRTSARAEMALCERKTVSVSGLADDVSRGADGGGVSE